MQKRNLELFIAQTEEGMYEDNNPDYIFKLEEIRLTHQKEIQEKLDSKIFTGTKSEILIQQNKYQEEITKEYNEKLLVFSQELKTNYNDTNEKFFNELKFQLDLSNEEIIFFREILNFKLNGLISSKEKQVIAIQEFMFYKQLLIDGNLKIITNE